MKERCMGPIGNDCGFKKFAVEKNLQTFCCGYRFYCFRILYKTPKNCFGFLALQSTCTAVGYFNRCDFEFFIKI